MPQISIPDELYKKALEIADEQHVSVDSVVASAFTQHLALLGRFQRRAAQGERGKFLAVLSRAADVEPAATDAIQ